MTTNYFTSNQQTIERLFDAFRSGRTEDFDDLIVENYVQHNPQGGDGLAAMKAVFSGLGPLEIEVHRVIADGDLVAVHSHFTNLGVAAVDIFRLNDEGKIVEHWDVLQPVPATSTSGNDMFSQRT